MEDSPSFGYGTRERVRGRRLPDDAPSAVNRARWDADWVELFVPAAWDDGPFPAFIAFGRGLFAGSSALIGGGVFSLLFGILCVVVYERSVGTRSGTTEVALCLLFLLVGVVAAAKCSRPLLRGAAWLSKRAVRPFFAGRGPSEREEESVGGAFVEAAVAVAALTLLAGGLPAWLLGVPGRTVFGITAVVGLIAGVYRAALELDVHARRRESLREVLRRADGLLSAGDAGGAGDEARAEPAPAAPDLPPYVAGAGPGGRSAGEGRRAGDAERDRRGGRTGRAAGPAGGRAGGVRRRVRPGQAGRRERRRGGPRSPAGTMPTPSAERPWRGSSWTCS